MNISLLSHGLFQLMAHTPVSKQVYSSFLFAFRTFSIFSWHFSSSSTKGFQVQLSHFSAGIKRALKPLFLWFAHSDILILQMRVCRNGCQQPAINIAAALQTRPVFRKSSLIHEGPQHTLFVIYTKGIGWTTRNHHWRSVRFSSAST